VMPGATAAQLQWKRSVVQPPLQREALAQDRLEIAAACAACYSRMEMGDSAPCCCESQGMRRRCKSKERMRGDGMVSSGEVAGSEDEREPDWESSIAADAVLSSLQRPIAKGVNSRRS
ncbi:unnamed protein product, partial [Symbiodinium sp. KB8]